MCVQAAHVSRLEHLSDAVVCLESFVGTPMETDSTFKAYNGNNLFFVVPVTVLRTCSLISRHTLHFFNAPFD